MSDEQLVGLLILLFVVGAGVVGAMLLWLLVALVRLALRPFRRRRQGGLGSEYEQLVRKAGRERRAETGRRTQAGIKRRGGR